MTDIVQHFFPVYATCHPDGTVTWAVDAEYPGFDTPIWDEDAGAWCSVGGEHQATHLALLDQLGGVLAAVPPTPRAPIPS